MRVGLFAFKTRIKTMTKENKRSYSVWVGGTEVNDAHLTYTEAVKMRDHYLALGYDDVAITD